MSLDLVTTLRSTGAVRAFRPDAVPDDVVVRVLDTARFAPSGGNRQGWRVVLVKDASVRRSLRDLYLEGWYEYLSQRAAGLVPFAPVTDDAAEAAANASASDLRGMGGDFAERLDEAPVLLVLLADLRVIAAVDKSFDRYTLAGGASIYPFAWSVLLAARAEGLGGVMTTMPVRREPEVKSLLHVPDELVVAGLLVLGVPVHQPTKLTRNTVESFTTVDRYDGPPLRP
ncbi:MAG TPA: nitroreductase family protein [Acidimicrobiales bacterium]|nr:nitroreductase family protein [Acidimicrobiales bacterium]